MFTQPLMYRQIRKTKPGLDKYADKLITEGVVSDEEVKVFCTYSSIWRSSIKELKLILKNF